MLNSIAVLGGGLAGCIVALSLAKKGFTVNLYEQHPVLMNAASLHNEGKLHLGYVYAADPSQKTYKKMVQGVEQFSTIISQLTDYDSKRLQTSSPFYYIVLKASQLSLVDTRQHFARVDQALSVSNLNLPPSIELAPCQWHKDFTADAVATVFKTAEYSIDPQQLASIIYAAVTQNENINVLTNHTILSVQQDRAEYKIKTKSLHLLKEMQHKYVINCLWEQRMRFDREIGLIEQRPFFIRYKATVRFYIPRLNKTPLKSLNSVTYITGPFGDVVNYQNGYLYLSWYPFSKLYESASDELKEFEARRSQLNKAEFIHKSIKRLSEFNPVLSNLHQYEKQAVVGGGYIVAWGNSDIDDEDSELHQRHDIGVHQKDNWLSLDTGKLTTAPLLGVEAANIIEHKIRSSSTNRKLKISNA